MADQQLYLPGFNPPTKRDLISLWGQRVSEMQETYRRRYAELKDEQIRIELDYPGEVT